MNSGTKSYYTKKMFPDSYFFAAFLVFVGSINNRTKKMDKIKIGFVAVAWIMLNTGCIKNTSCTPKTVQSEEAAMINYALAIGMTTTQHSSGMLYEIINQGSGATASLSSIISVKYTGKLTNGVVFDSQTTTPVTFQLSDAIQGWKNGIPLIQKGGVIKLIIPSSLAYGCSGFGTVPPDSILYFEIELTDVQ